jgi:hypothetical protein
VPNKILDLLDFFLMRFWYQDDEGTPRSVTFADPTVGNENVLLFENNGGLAWPVVWLATTNRLWSTRVDGEFESKDRETDASFMEHIPVLVDHHLNSAASLEVNRSTNSKVFAELGVVAISVLKVNIGASRDKSHGFSSNRITVLGEY